MSTRKTIVIVLVLLLATALAGVLHWNGLPDPMASHWDIHDQVNGTMPKFWGVFLTPLISLFLRTRKKRNPTMRAGDQEAQISGPH